MRFAKFISLIIFLSFAFTISLFTRNVWAEKRLTLEESIAIALQKNRDILIAKDDIKVSKGKLVQARSSFLPRLDAVNSYRLFNKAPTVEVPTGAFGNPDPMEMTIDFTYDYSLGLSLTQPIFAGGSIWYSNKMASEDLKFSQAKYDQVKNDIIFSTIERFNGALLAEEFIKVNQEALDLAIEQRVITQKRYKSGEASEFDLIRAEVAEANLKPDLISSKNSLNLSILAFKELLGEKLDEEVAVFGELKKEMFSKNLDECISQALRKRPELEELRKSTNITSYALKAARGGFFPSLAFTTSYNSTTNDFFGSWITSYSGFLVLSFPLFDGFKTLGAVSEARANLKKVSDLFIQTEERVKLETRSAFLNLSEAEEILTSTSENVRQAEKSVNIAMEQYKTGIIDSLDLMQARLALTQARINQLRATYSQAVSVASIKRVIGSLYEEYGNF